MALSNRINMRGEGGGSPSLDTIFDTSGLASGLALTGNLSIQTYEQGYCLYVPNIAGGGQILGVNINNKGSLTVDCYSQGNYIVVDVNKNGSTLKSTVLTTALNTRKSISIDISQYSSQGDIELNIRMAGTGSIDKGYIYGLYLS